MISCSGCSAIHPQKVTVKGYKDAREDAGIGDYAVVGEDLTAQTEYMELRFLLHREKGQQPFLRMTISAHRAAKNIEVKINHIYLKRAMKYVKSVKNYLN